MDFKSKVVPVVMLTLAVVLLSWLSVTWRWKFTGPWRLLATLGRWRPLGNSQGGRYCLGFIKDDPELLKQIILKTNAARISEAEVYLRERMITRPRERNPAESELVVTIVTTRRTSPLQEPRYLLQSATAFHKELQETPAKISLTICDVNTEDDPEVQALSRHIRTFTKRSVNTSNLSND